MHAETQTQIADLTNALDSHTVDNRNKRKELNEKRQQLAEAMKAIAKPIQEGQKILQGLYQSVQAALELAEHAKDWEWKEVQAAAEGERAAPAAVAAE